MEVSCKEVDKIAKHNPAGRIRVSGCLYLLALALLVVVTCGGVGAISNESAN